MDQLRSTFGRVLDGIADESTRFELFKGRTDFIYSTNCRILSLSDEQSVVWHRVCGPCLEISQFPIVSAPFTAEGLVEAVSRCLHELSRTVYRPPHFRM